MAQEVPLDEGNTTEVHEEANVNTLEDAQKDDSEEVTTRMRTRQWVAADSSAAIEETGSQFRRRFSYAANFGAKHCEDRSADENEIKKDANAGTLVEKRAKILTKLQKKAKAIDDLLYSSSNHRAVKEGLVQYSDLFELLINYHKEYCDLSASDDLEEQAQWFEDLDEKVFNYKHKIHN